VKNFTATKAQIESLNYIEKVKILNLVECHEFDIFSIIVYRCNNTSDIKLRSVVQSNDDTFFYNKPKFYLGLSIKNWLKPSVVKFN
jgi:hypothetical protein